MNRISKIGLTLGFLLSMSCLSGCAAMMTGMEFLAEIGECAAGVDCVQDRNGFDGVQSDDGMSAIAAGTRSLPSTSSASKSKSRSTSTGNGRPACGRHACQ